MIRKYGIVWLCLIVVIFHVNHSIAQQNEDAVYYGNMIDKVEMKKHLTVLSSDEYEGRETGKQGQKRAAQYIADFYENMGILPIVDGSWFQYYPLKEESSLGSYAMINGNRYDYVKDFYVFGSEWENVNLEKIVFIGYGIEDERYTDYKKNTNLNGKVALCLLGEPMDKNGQSKITGDYITSEWTQEWEKKTQVAFNHGAEGIIFINPYYDMYVSRIRYWLETPSMRLDYPERKEYLEENISIPEIFISARMGDFILQKNNKSVQGLRKRISKKMKSIPFDIKKTKLNFHVEHRKKTFDAENVVCYIEGSDEELKNELIVISAHYDHIGITDGEINNGADDDGSGTVAVMQLAKAFHQAKLDGKGVKRSILVLNVSGEEKGLLGSEWYTAYPVFPLKNTVCNLNIDMIGREDKKNAGKEYVYIIGSDKLSSELHEISENVNKTYTHLKLDYTYNNPNDPNRLYYRSDHYNFAKNNIPVIFYFSGLHEDYHRPTDDIEKILFDQMTARAKLIFFTAWDVANRPERLKVDRENDFQQHR